MIKKCPEYQTNRHVPDFTCNLPKGHTDPHRDPQTGTRWRHGPALPKSKRVKSAGR